MVRPPGAGGCDVLVNTPLAGAGGLERRFSGSGQYLHSDKAGEGLGFLRLRLVLVLVLLRPHGDSLGPPALNEGETGCKRTCYVRTYLLQVSPRTRY